MKKNVAVLISGSGTNLQALIDACAQHDFPARIVLVLSNKAEAFGLQRAQQAGIPTTVLSHADYPSREAYDAAVTKILEQAGVQIVCLAGFMRLLSAEFVEYWKDRLINIHPSLLPAYRGLNTHARALEDKAKLAGCTVHFVRHEVDDGPIIIQAAVPVKEGDTPQSLAARVLEKEHVIYPKALRWLAEGSLGIEGARVTNTAHDAADAAMIPGN